MSACPDTKDAVQIRRGHLLISSQDVSPLRVGLIVNVVGMMAITILHNRGCILSVRYAVPMPMAMADRVVRNICTL